jgi:superfamily II DNA/RNA helicase
MGFIPDIERICKLVPFTRQTLFFSATMPREIIRLTEAFLHNPVRIEVAPAASSPAAITQVLVASEPGAAKRMTLRKQIRAVANFKNAIIFCNRKRDVALLHTSLQRHGFRAGALHGDMDQRARMASLDAFKTGEVDLIVCSDVAARGLDIPDVSHVFNFDVPVHSEDYVHRIGRTGRAGKQGTAITIVTRLDRKHLAEIEKLIGHPIGWLEGATFEDLGVPAPDESVPEKPARRHDRGTGSRRPSQEHTTANGGERGAHRPEARKAQDHRPHVGKAQEHETRRAQDHKAEERTGRPAPAFADHGNRPVIGMGDHTPSFLLRPVKLKPKIAEEAE